MNLRHLRFALAAADHGSFRRAAQALGVDSSVLSRRVRDLEIRLGFRLFHRATDGVRLTKAGEWFMPQARDAVDQLDLVFAASTQLPRGAVQYRVRLWIERCYDGTHPPGSDEASDVHPVENKEAHAALAVVIEEESAISLAEAVRFDGHRLEMLLAATIEDIVKLERRRTGLHRPLSLQANET